jgi:hypothetical protein
MKKLGTLIIVVALGVFQAQAAPATETDTTTHAPQLTLAQWDAFSHSLVRALRSDHSGLQQAAMRLIIQYGDQVNVRSGLHDLARIYREADSDFVRRMAVMALARTEHPWAIDFLERSERFEQTPRVRRQIQAVLAEYHAADHS